MGGELAFMSQSMEVSVVDTASEVVSELSSFRRDSVRLSGLSTPAVAVATTFSVAHYCRGPWPEGSAVLMSRSLAIHSSNSLPELN